jgi:G3E family GTPase
LAPNCEQVLEAIQKVNTTAEVMKTQYSKVDIQTLIEKKEKKFEAKVDLEKVHKLQHKILDEVKSIYFQGTESLSKDKLEPLIGSYLWESTNILRCKGVFYDGSEWQLLQGVGEMFEFRPCAAPE